MNQEQILKELRIIDAALSPENLYRDGEATPAEVEAQRRRLLARQAELERQLGHKPSIFELYPKAIAALPE
ncbi:MAG TPA: hypothetical protein GYA07_12745 [Verrucomicrobia bacterium]|nr:hypothetical protein [Verrucomicrobiota bacterium]HOP98956.1 hypothetical protein [Verrucomicrobiota bacterium]